ncbi:MAG: ComF family protein [Planctomycetia bacterium]|nr:ComF family protein [Planctomycetia bacterium]
MSGVASVRKGLFRRAGGAALDVLFPPRCAYCQGDLAESEICASVCALCRYKLVRDLAPCCRKCGAPVGALADVREGCGRCRDRKFQFQSVIYLGLYVDDLRSAVLRAKHPHQDLLTDALADLLVDRQAPALADFRAEIACGVPMHWRRRWLRGTNSAERMAGRLARRLSIPTLPLLRRTRATQMQAGLSPAERQANMRGAFAARRGQPIGGARVLLVDDVMTTGATCGECAKALVASGAAAVMVAVVARAEGTQS